MSEIFKIDAAGMIAKYGDAENARLDTEVMDALIEKLGAQRIKPKSITVGEETFTLKNGKYEADTDNAKRPDKVEISDEEI
jgi:hypothetical protein